MYSYILSSLRGPLETPNDPPTSLPEKTLSSLRRDGFGIKPGEEVEIVGRAGAGKSSLMRALLRYVHVYLSFFYSLITCIVLPSYSLVRYKSTAETSEKRGLTFNNFISTDKIPQNTCGTSVLNVNTYGTTLLKPALIFKLANFSLSCSLSISIRLTPTLALRLQQIPKFCQSAHTPPSFEIFELKSMNTQQRKKCASFDTR